MDRYEMQVLDSYKDKTYFDGQASAIYKQTPPMVNAMRPPGEWNTYDIVWNAPKFKDDGSLESPAYITVLHNGVLTHNHFALEGITHFTEVPHYDEARQTADPFAGPRQSGAVSQHLGARDQADRGQARAGAVFSRPRDGQRYADFNARESGRAGYLDARARIGVTARVRAQAK